jgi:hypothetical protein
LRDAAVRRWRHGPVTSAFTRRESARVAFLDYTQDQCQSFLTVYPFSSFLLFLFDR